MGAQMEELVGRAANIFWRDVKKHMVILQNDGKDIRVVDIAARHRNVLSTFVAQCILTGDFGKGHKGMTRPYELSDSDLSGISLPRQTNIYLPKASKALSARQIHGSQYGFVCPAESPQGDTIGYLKTLAASAEISSMGDDGFWIENITKCIVQWRPNLQRVMLNGRIYGAPKGSIAEVYAFLKGLTRKDPPYHAVVILRDDEIYVDNTPGRWVRPLFVAPHHPDTHPELVGLTFDELIALGVLEYIDASVDVFIAPKPADIQEGITHVEIHPALMFGHSAGRVPFADHDAAPRVAFQADMGKQVGSLSLYGGGTDACKSRWAPSSWATAAMNRVTTSCAPLRLHWLGRTSNGP